MSPRAEAGARSDGHRAVRQTTAPSRCLLVGAECGCRRGATKAPPQASRRRSRGAIRRRTHHRQTDKDATTVRMQTEEYHVTGPAMIFFTTTNIEIDEELQNRCLTLTVDESREQTRRIHQLQREARTLEGLERKRRRALVRRANLNAARARDRARSVSSS